MHFVNHTPFPALAFGGVDTHGRNFHVVVLRQTLTWDSNGVLRFADLQAPLCEVDETFDSSPSGCVRQESDLCHFKPRCDIIVNADAHAPKGSDGKHLARFQVRLMVMRPDTPAPLPPAPQGLNPWMPPSRQAMANWQAEVDQAQSRRVPGERLVDKTLQISGERDFAKAGGLAIFGRGSWHLTEPSRQAVVPIRLDRAFGGQCRIERDTPQADKVPAKHRLSTEQVADHPDEAYPPMAHDFYAANPAGRGYVSDWFLNVTASMRVAAPQIEYPGRPITSDDFAAARRGQLSADSTLVAGLGVRPKGHPERARQVGQIDRQFVQSDAALPRGFDFSVWNAAWPDQQTEYLQGDEVVGLVNLCAADTHGAWQDAQGQVLLRLVLPAQVPFVLVRQQSGAMAPVRLNLDTLIVEPQALLVSAVYRAVIPADEPVRCLEARQMPLYRWQTSVAINELTRAIQKRQAGNVEAMRG